MGIKQRIVFKNNPMAKDVRTPKYKPRVVQPKKGKGSYKRVNEHEQRKEI